MASIEKAILVWGNMENKWASLQADQLQVYPREPGGMVCTKILDFFKVMHFVWLTRGGVFGVSLEITIIQNKFFLSGKLQGPK